MPASRQLYTRPALLALFWLWAWAPLAEAAGVLQFLEPRLNAREGETHEITVIRSGSSSGAVTVVLNVSLGGTAIIGDDYTVELPLGVIQIPDGQLFGRARLNVLQNTGVQGTRYAVFTLANPAGATLGRDSTLLLQIEDDQPADAALEITGAPVRRVTAGEALPIEVTRDGLEDSSVSVTLLGVPGTAALGIDYSDLTLALEFAAQENLQDATLTTIARTEPAFPRTLSLVLASPAPAGQAAFEGFGPLVVIEDPPGARAGEFSLFASAAEVSEGDGSVLFTVDRNRGSTGAASVDWVTVDGTGASAAVAGADFVAATGTLEFAAGETRKTFEVELVDDDEVRDNRRFFEVALANPSTFAGLDPEGRRVTITVLEDDGEPRESCKGFCDCFIATAAWGSWMDPHVVSLRGFRDEVLLRHAAGRTFVAFYYQHSPALAGFISRHEALRFATRAALAPVVFAIERPGTTGSLLLLGFVVLLNLRRATSRRINP